MATVHYALKQVKFYERTYRHRKLRRFRVSGLYDLYPEKGTSYTVEESWPGTWLNLSDAGVYLMLDDNLQVVYIGKSNHFGRRLSSYFVYDENKKCKANDTWQTYPRFVMTIAVPCDSKFECSALEEFLLSKIVTSDNKLHNNWTEMSTVDTLV